MKKPWYKKWWVWILAVVVVLAFGSSDTEEPTSQPVVKDETKEVEKPEVKEFFSVGEEITLDGATLIVNTVEKSTGTQYDSPQSGNEYVIVEVTIKNSGTSDLSYNPLYFSMQNSKGQITDYSFTMVNSDTALSSGSLASGGEVSGTIAFEQPIDDAGLILKYEPNLFSSKQIKVRLN